MTQGLDTLQQAWQALHWLRPQWLWALTALPLIVLLWSRHGRRVAWKQIVDAHLLPHLLVRGERAGRWRLPALLLAWTLAVLALAGPSWQQREQPLWHEQAPLVVVLDLSSRITATDIAPSRLLQARAAIARLLQLRKGGSIGLVVFADDAFTVAPLTDDAGNVSVFLDALSPDIMPRDGHDPARGVDAAVALMRQAGAKGGDVLLMTDAADTAAIEAARRAALEGYRVHALGLGSSAGAAFRQGTGDIGQARLDAASLQSLAGAGKGRYVRLQAPDVDLATLGVLQPGDAAAAKQGDGQQRVAIDGGWWLLPPLMLLALLAFRRQRQVLAVLLVLGLPLGVMPSARAQDVPQRGEAAAPSTKGTLWQRADQREHEQLQQGVEQYRSGDAAAAERSFRGIETDEGWYNLGNALARQGRYDEAIAAYDQALQRRPGMPDAVTNKGLVEQARRQQHSRDKKDKSGGQGSGQSPPEKPPGQQGQGPQAGQDPGSDGAPANAGQAPRRGQAGDPADTPGQQVPAPEGAGADAKPEQTPGDSAARQRAQQRADARQRQAMQEALQKQREAAHPSAKPVKPVDQAGDEQRQAVEAWMRRVPDVPGNLLRERFLREDQRRRREGR